MKNINLCLLVERPMDLCQPQGLNFQNLVCLGTNLPEISNAKKAFTLNPRHVRAGYTAKTEATLYMLLVSSL